MMKFQHIEYLLALLLVLLMLFLYFNLLSWKQKVSSRIGDPLLVKELISNFNPAKFRLKFYLVAAAVVFCSFGLANLRKPGGGEKITRNGIDVMIALDVSKSMLAQDIKPSRLDRAKQLLGKLVDKLENDRVGIVVFAGRAYIQMPLTADHAAAKMYIGSSSPEMVQTQGTVIGDALQRCYESFAVGEKKYKSVILISDGEDHDESAGEIATQMAAEGVVINTIGIGSPDGAPIIDPVTNEYKKDKDGNTVVSKLNETELKLLAQKGKGIYQLFTNTDEVAARLEAQLGSMDQRIVTDDSLVNYKTFFQWFLLAAVLLLIAELFIPENNKVVKMNFKNLKRTGSLTICMLLFAAVVNAQSENELIRKGNAAYNKKEFGTASATYKKVADKNPANNTAQYNLGNALYKSNKAEEALQAYDKAVETARSPEDKAQAYYNKGVALQNSNKLPECIDAYKHALRINPKDQDARLNLQKALIKQKQEQQKQQQDQKNKKDPKDDPKKKDDQKKDDQKKKEDQQPKPEPSKISKKEAEEKLQALLQQEKNLQDKLRKANAASPNQPDKDW